MALVLLTLAPMTASGQMQSLGIRLPGTVGLDAGAQPKPGLYLTNRAVFFESSALFGPTGNELPVGLELNAFANAIGVGGVIALPFLGTRLNLGFGVPIARVHLSTAAPEASLDRLGLGDLFVQPLKLGWSREHFDVVAGYGFYVPVSRQSPGGTGQLSSSQWMNEFVLGGLVASDVARTFRASVLASYQMFQPKEGIDVTRGDTLQFQGGVGTTVWRNIDLGVIGYALWQVRDNRGADVPAVLVDARERAFGLGAELGVRLDPVPLKVTVRYAHDFAVQTRPRGQLVLLGLTLVVPIEEREKTME